MKRVSIVLLAYGAIGIGITTLVDDAVAEPAGEPQGAVLLQTQSVSVNQPTVTLVGNTPASATPYTRENLNSISASIQSRPQAPVGGLALPAFIPRGLETGPSPSTSVNPLEFFRVQAPDRGVRFRVSDTP